MIKLNFGSTKETTLGECLGISKERFTEMGDITSRVSADFVEGLMGDDFTSIDIAKKITEEVAPTSPEEIAVLYYPIYVITQKIFEMRAERNFMRDIKKNGGKPPLSVEDLLKNNPTK